MQSHVYVLVGPTAVGKSKVAQLIAEKNGWDILSADAMMVYRGMDIGTAKPPLEYRARVRYFGLDLVSPSETFSVWQFCRHALEAIRKAKEDKREIIAVGGSGLYIKGLTHGLGKLPAPDLNARAAAVSLLNEKGIVALQTFVRERMPEIYDTLPDKNNPRRLMRLIETANVADRYSVGTWKAMGKGPKITGLSMPKAMLDERIAQRVQEMYANGLLQEAERLLGEGIEKSPTASKAIGYAEAFAVLRNKMSVDEAMEMTCRRSRQYAKRQMTWFRNQADVDWIMVEPGMTVEQTATEVQNYWHKNGPAPIAL